ncbi:MAG TPA: twin-arginine translocase subunit TatC [Anaerolineales bacterium]|nr:twin-arginine translocase subunit TatC [Anaerolineales bacterium]
MKNFFNALWRIVRFPFWLIFTVLVFPFRLIGRGIRFINTDTEDRPILDTFTSLATEEQARASFWDHVEALRGHLLRMVIGLAIGVGISFYFTKPLMEYIAKPIGGLSKLIAIQPTEEIGVFMRVALTSGIAITLPYLAFEIWLFAAPGLTSREKKNTLVGIPIATVLFLAGMAFTFYVLLPSALPFLGNFTAITQNWRAGDYFGFVTGLMIWIGIFFEFPLVIYLLTSIGLVQPSLLAKQWRIAIVVISIIAAAVTPTVDPVNMALVMLPMSLLYFVSIGLSYIAYAGRRKNLAASEESV